MALVAVGPTWKKGQGVCPHSQLYVMGGHGPSPGCTCQSVGVWAPPSLSHSPPLLAFSCIDAFSTAQGLDQCLPAWLPFRVQELKLNNFLLEFGFHVKTSLHPINSPVFWESAPLLHNFARAFYSSITRQHQTTKPGGFWHPTIPLPPRLSPDLSLIQRLSAYRRAYPRAPVS